jgi:hypothetical protein
MLAMSASAGENSENKKMNASASEKSRMPSITDLWIHTPTSCTDKS